MESTAHAVVFVKTSHLAQSFYKASALEVYSHSLEWFLFPTDVCEVLPFFLFLGACVKLHLLMAFTFWVFLEGTEWIWYTHDSRHMKPHVWCVELCVYL